MDNLHVPMSNPTKPVMNLVSERNISSCITDGWKLLGENLWTMIKSSWPLLLLNALWGGFIGLGILLFAKSTVGLIAVIVGEILLTLLFLLQTTLLIRKRHELGYFSSAKPWVLWKSDTKDTLRSFWSHLKTIITTPRQWGLYLAILIICGIVYHIVKTIFSIPVAVLMLCDFSATESVLLGDAIQLPATFPYLLFLFGAIAYLFQAIATWIIYFPVACGMGHFRFLELEAANSEAHE